MALTLNSPGVQIIETDLSNYLNTINGTTVFIAGFASQGPTDEVLQITSSADLQTIYGAPATPAERYFYHSAQAVLNSNGNLLTTRLPYGSGSGYGFAAQTYSALFFPALTSSNNSVQFNAPTHVTLTESEFTALANNNFTWSGITSGTTTVTQTSTIATSSVTLANSAVNAFISTLSTLEIGIVPESYTITLPTSSTTTVGYSYTAVTNVSSSGTTASWTSGSTFANAGLIILNDSQTVVDEYSQGYYITVTDNNKFGPNSDFNAVTSFLTLTGADSFGSIPQNSTRLGFSLSASVNAANSQSVSQQIERAFSFDFSQPDYNDCVTINLWKVRNSIYDPSVLSITPVETYVGSLNSQRKIADPNGGSLKSFYIPDLINGNSNNLTVLVNPALATSNVWSTSGAQVSANTTSLYPEGVYSPSYKISQNKIIGECAGKLTRALSLIDTPENVKVDIVADAGISTIFANTPSNGIYDDTLYLDTAGLNNSSSLANQNWGTIYNIFDEFVSQTRKDCVFIADPLRQIFVNGRDTKVLSVKSNTFTQNVYTPLKAMLAAPGADSNYSAIYGNWVKSYDTFSSAYSWLPASGFVSAIYANSDAATQPWFAPAGLNRGIIRGITDIAVNPNQKQRDYLYLISINPIAFFNGEGYVVFGQKTLQAKPSAFDRVNVRRLFLTLERAVGNAVKYFVFEPNTDFTRTRLVNTITPIFDLAKNTQGLYDYKIVCDSRNNTPFVIDRNELAVDIYIKPVKAAEFILVNFIATTTGQNFSELV